MGKKNTKKNKKKNADHKEKTMIEGESSSAAEKAVSSERNSNQEPETKKLQGDTSSSSEGNEKKIDGGGHTLTLEQVKERERIAEEESWMRQKDSSERKSSSAASSAKDPVHLFATMLKSNDVDPASNQVVLRLSHRRIKDALLMNEKFKKIPYVSVLARDPQKREYHLRFSRYKGETYILSHEWAKFVAANGLEEGDEFYGNGIYTPRQFRALLSFKKKEMRSLAPNVSREKNGEEPPICLLFDKKMDREDLKEQLAIDCCSQKAKMAIQQTTHAYIRVLTADPDGNVYDLRLSRCIRQGTYVLGQGWGRIVAENGLGEGDTVTGIGLVGNHGFIAVLHFIKNGETMEEALIRKEKKVFFFEKDLEFPDINTLLDQLEIESFKEVMREIVAKAEQVEGSEGYVRVSATVEEGRKYELRLSRDSLKGTYVLYHQWRDVVIANELMCGDTVTCWGGLAKDGTIKMNIDVCKAIEYV